MLAAEALTLNKPRTSKVLLNSSFSCKNQLENTAMFMCQWVKG